MGVLLFADEVCRVLGFVQCFSGFDLCRVDTKKCKHSKQKKEFANIKINEVFNILSISFSGNRNSYPNLFNLS